MDICGYIDQQYSILNRSLLEAEIEYQHECFETLKKKYDRYITEADEEEFEDDWDDVEEPEKISKKDILLKYAGDTLGDLKKKIQKFFDNIINAMQRWILKILNYSTRFRDILTKIFDEEKFKAPSLGIKETAAYIATCLNEYSNDPENAKSHLESAIHELGNAMTEPRVTDYREEMKCILEYKGAINTIKNAKKTIINSSKVDGKEYVETVKEEMWYIKLIMAMMHKRATYSAKLMLKAIKIAKQKNTEKIDIDIEKMDNDIDNFKYQ